MPAPSASGERGPERRVSKRRCNGYRTEAARDRDAPAPPADRHRERAVRKPTGLRGGERRVHRRAPHGEPQGRRLRGLAADLGRAATLDIRGTLETHDGAIIYINYDGKSDLSGGLVFPVTIYVAPRFETSDPRYAWLNKVQAVGKGFVDENLSLEYEWYEMA